MKPPSARTARSIATTAGRGSSLSSTSTWKLRIQQSFTSSLSRPLHSSRSTATGPSALSSPPRRAEQPGHYRYRDQPRERKQEEASGPPRRAARSIVILSYGLIWNVLDPVETLPLMSVASHRKVVVELTTKDWPGSRGPVESHSVEVLFGADPSVV